MPRWLCGVLCEYTGISNALFNTPRRPYPGGCVGCYVSTLGSAMHCSTPQTTMPRWLCGVLCEYTGISNALFNTPRRPCPGRCVGCYVSTLGSAMHCSTPQTTMPRWLCAVFMVQITSLHNGRIAKTTLVLSGPVEPVRLFRPWTDQRFAHQLSVCLLLRRSCLYPPYHIHKLYDALGYVWTNRKQLPPVLPLHDYTLCRTLSLIYMPH